MESKNKISLKMLSRPVRFGAFCILLFSLVLSLPNRAIQSDENWFGEQAYWLAHEGVVKLKSIPDIFEWDTEMLVHHKLVTWTGAGIIKVFGWSLWPLRGLMLILVTTTLFLLYNVSRLKVGIDKNQTIIALFLLLITPEFIDRIILFRPEIFVMFFGVSSFFCLLKIDKEKSFNYATLAGIFAGLAFLSHLNAVIFPVAGFILLATHKKWKPLIYFTLPCFLVCMIYTEGLWAAGKLEQYLFELKNWPSHNFSEKVDGGILNSIFNNIIGLLSEHKRYFWDQNVWVISGLFFLSLIGYFKKLRKQTPFLVDYVLLLMLFLGLLGGGHAPRYLMYLFPFMALVIAAAIQFSVKEDKTWKTIFLSSIITAQIVLLALNYNTIFKSKFDHQKWNNKVLENIERGTNIIGPWHLIYNNLAQYQIFNFKTFEYQEEKMDEPFTQQEILQKLAQRKIDYIILDKTMQHDKVFHWFNYWEIVDNPYFTAYRKTEDYLILKRK